MSQTKVPLPPSGTITRKSGKYSYVYKVIQAYRTESGQPTNKRVSIGKLDMTTGLLIPNETYWLHYGESANTEVIVDISYRSVRAIGAAFLVKSILEGKMFCAFISLIAVSKLSSMLSDFMKKRGMSKEGLISEMEKIKIITLNDGVRLMNPITKTQRTILEACGLSADDIKSSIYAV